MKFQKHLLIALTLPAISISTLLQAATATSAYKDHSDGKTVISGSSSRSLAGTPNISLQEEARAAQTASAIITELGLKADDLPAIKATFGKATFGGVDFRSFENTEKRAHLASLLAPYGVTENLIQEVASRPGNSYNRILLSLGLLDDAPNMVAIKAAGTATEAAIAAAEAEKAVSSLQRRASRSAAAADLAEAEAATARAVANSTASRIAPAEEELISTQVVQRAAQERLTATEALLAERTTAVKNAEAIVFAAELDVNKADEEVRTSVTALATARADVQTTNAEIERLNHELEAAQAAAAGAQSLIDKTVARKAVTDEILANARAAVTSLEGAVAATTTAAKSATGVEKDTSVAENKAAGKAGSALHDARIAYTDAENNHAAAVLAEENARSAFARAQQSITEISDRVAESTRRREASEASLKSTEERLATAQANLQQRFEAIKGYKATLTTARQAVAETNSTLAAERANFAKAQAEVAAKTLVVTTIRDEANAKEGEALRLEAKAAEARSVADAAVATKNATIAAVQAKHAELEGELAMVGRTAGDLKGIVAAVPPPTPTGGAK